MKRILTVALLLLLQAAFVSSFACTTAIIGPQASASGKPMIWKQRDTDNPSNVMVHVPATAKTMAYTALFNSDDVERLYVYGGQNEAGFAILNNMSYNLASRKYVPTNGTVMRLALEKCTTVDEFETMLREMPGRLCTSNFAVLDSTGACAYIEAADTSVARFDAPADGWLVRSNYSISGSEDGPSGYARYESAYRLMKRHRGPFSPADLIDGLGRSYFNAVLGYDASRWFRRRFAFDEDFIPRPTTTSSICIDGDRVWAAVGYTPGTLMVPFTVKDGFGMPSCIQPSGEYDGGCAADALGAAVKSRMHPLPRDAARKYVDFREFRRVRKIVRRYEKQLAGMAGADPAEIDALFEQFRTEVI